MRSIRSLTKKIFGTLFLFYFFLYSFSYASDITSTSFIIRDPVFGTGGGYGSSGSFKFFGTGNTIFSDGGGTSTSFKIHEGFLYYPKVTDVVLTATPTGSTAHLTWTAAVSNTGLGWTVSGYKTGIASVSGGPYTFTSVGNVLTYDYTSLTPGNYCFVVQTLDGLGYVIGKSNEQCITIQPTITFSISNNSVQFGTLSSAAASYANTSGGSLTNTVAHTMTASSNAPNGYTISYNGPTLTSSSNTISPAVISNDLDGTPGSAQFALSLSSSGSASITSAYNQSNSPNPNWKFVANTTETVASTAGVTTSETFSNRYIANITPGTPAGSYATALTYVITGNF